MNYNYEHFEREILSDDSAFQGGPPPGDLFPAFELPTTTGDTVRKENFLGKPLLVILSSFT